MIWMPKTMITSGGTRSLSFEKALLEPVLETASNEVEITGTQAETQSAPADSPLLFIDDSDPDANPHTSSVVTRITAVEDKVDLTMVALGQLSSMATNLEERVAKLDEKIIELTNMLGDLMLCRLPQAGRDEPKPSKPPRKLSWTAWGSSSVFASPEPRL
jgi:uncharacterized coiled-coil protein SlyX